MSVLKIWFMTFLKKVTMITLLKTIKFGTKTKMSMSII